MDIFVGVPQRSIIGLLLFNIFLYMVLFQINAGFIIFKANSDKCCKLVRKNLSFIANIGKNKICNTKTEKLLGFTFNNQLTLNNHVSNLCKTASNKLHMFSTIVSYLDQDKNSYYFSFYI